jgi:hypothetical protein
MLMRAVQRVVNFMNHRIRHIMLDESLLFDPIDMLWPFHT